MRIPSSRWLVVWLLLGVVVAIAQPQKSEPRASISGRVTNSATGAPIIRAHVTLFSSSQQRYGVLTGADGRFTITGLPSGEHIIEVEATGFQRPFSSWDVPTNRVALQPNEYKHDINFVLTPLGAISGRVLDAEGQPLQGMTISVLSVEGGTEGELSDPDGQYRIGNLPPGKYRVWAAPASYGNLPPEIRTDGTTEVHYAPTYYPDSLTIESAVPLEVQPGSERTGIDIRLVRTPIVAARGAVSGIPADAREVQVVVRKIEPPPERLGRRFADQRRVNPDGSFVIWRLDPGSYILNAQSYPEGWTSPPLQINVADKDIGDLAMHLVPLADISGRILFDDEEARFPPTPPNASLAEHPQISMEGQTSNSSYFSVIADDGSFHFDKARPERYSVYISAGRYVKSMRLNSVDIQGSILDLRKSSGNPSLTMTASSDTGEISGIVRGADGPVAYARVAFFSETENTRTSDFVLTAHSDGTYSADLKPGKFKLVALNPGVINAGAIRYFLEDYTDIVETVEIRPGESITRDLRQHIKNK